MFNKLKVAVFNAVSGGGDVDQSAQLGITDKGPDLEKPLKFKYKRPFFLSFTSDEEVLVSVDHHSRPIIVPRDTSRLPWHSGYAEAVNAGKSTWNEDQAFIERRELRRGGTGETSKSLATSSIGTEMVLPYVYFGLFDGHAGIGASLAAANQLHHLVHKRLMEVVEQLLPRLEDIVQTGRKGGVAMWVPDKEADKEMLIRGALELAFHDMDQMISEDRKLYTMKGGCTALVALFILGKLFVANAGDSRAVMAKNKIAIPMSNDFTPESERARVRHLAALRPELLGNEFTRLDYIRRPTAHDLGKKILYRDTYMNGWAYKVVTRDDLKYPVVVGEGKRSRVLGTIGVTRGFGDHDLRAVIADVPVKPFLSSQPEILIFDIEEEEVTEWDVLIMGTDGLWDVTSNENAIEIVHKNLRHFRDDLRAKYTSAAQDLIMQSRGKHVGDSWRTHEGRAGSIDDISVFVIPLLPYKKEYIEWRTMYDAAWGICEPDTHNTFGKLSLRTSPIPTQGDDSAQNGASPQHSVKPPSDTAEEDIWGFDDDDDDDDATESAVPLRSDHDDKSLENWKEFTKQMGIISPESSETDLPSQQTVYTKPSPSKLSKKDVTMHISVVPQGSQSVSYTTKNTSHGDSTMGGGPSTSEVIPKSTLEDAPTSRRSGSDQLQRHGKHRKNRERRDSQGLPPT